jgi:molybdenum cofactor cytidylyltransferase
MVSCVILAAGSSARMGNPKPLLKFNNELNFFERIVVVYQSVLIRKIIVVTNIDVMEQIMNSSLPYTNYCRFILNHNPERERTYSIKLGLAAVQEESWVFLQNIDNPFVSTQILNKMISKNDGADFVVPEFGSRLGHPLLLSGKLVNVILKQEESNFNLRNILKTCKGRRVVVNDPEILVNINTPEDYKRHFKFSIIRK